MLHKLLLYLKTKSEIIFAKPKRLHFLLIAFSILNIFDLGTTLLLTEYFGYEIELNPLIHQMFLISPALVISYRLGTLTLFLLFIPWGAKKNFSLAYHGTQVVIAIFLVVGILHIANLFIIFK